MIAVYVLTGVVLIAMGTALGIIAIVSLAIHREERAQTFTITSPSAAASGTRAACGLYTSGPGVTSKSAARSWR
jgi:hypothetical protein